jgi:hypothetical protein
MIPKILQLSGGTLLRWLCWIEVTLLFLALVDRVM